MKVELLKRTTWDKVWYTTKIDGVFDHTYLSEDDAQRRYREIIENAKKPPVEEILKSEEV